MESAQTDILSNKRLLVVSPHLRLFIRDQVVALSRLFGHTSVLVPQPRFPTQLLEIPYIRKHFEFVELAKSSCEELAAGNRRVEMICPSYFSLPLESLRKRMPIICGTKSASMLRKKHVQFDIIHGHRADVAYIGALLKKQTGAPLVVTCHGSDVYDYPTHDEFRAAIARFSLGTADRVIAVSESDASAIRSLGVPDKRITLIPNGYNERIFRPLDRTVARTLLRIPSSGHVLVSVGTLSEVKGQRVLIQAMVDVARASENTLLYIVGTGPLEGNLREQADHLSLNKQVRFVGYQTPEQVRLWMCAADALIVPSLNEGFPTVIPEALACGTPIVGTGVGGIPDALANPSVGILVKPRSPSGLSEGIAEALSREWDTTAILDFAKKYSLESIFRQLTQLYVKLLGCNS